MNLKAYILTSLLLGSCFVALSQEHITGLDYNPFLRHGNKPLISKTTTLTLPFFEDFTNAGLFPDPAKWMDHQVYINNTMCVQPVSRGVATFDGLNAQGAPYDSFDNQTLRYADSLTSRPFDLSSYLPSDSIYLSFFFQPQGNGFAPETQDSLMLFLRKRTGWQKAWAVKGTTLHPFQQVMIAISDTAFLHTAFQFRFVNKVSMDLNDDVWNIDYIRLASNRNRFDTTLNDLATTWASSSLLSDYTAMPYRQFTANASAESANLHGFTAANWYSGGRTVSVGYTATEAVSQTPVFFSAVNTGFIASNDTSTFNFPPYPINYNAPSRYSKVVFENKYFLSSAGATDDKTNDTIVQQQVFDNYLAYDDGSAEKSYFLSLFPTLPAKLAIEFHLNEPDTLRGVAIYFGRQVPLAFSKFFSVAVYRHITLNSYLDTPVFQQDLYFPGYVDTINHFWYYRFDSPVPLPSGTFFLGTIQPAMSGSDSLYFGLDMNRVGGNHLYYNVLGSWQQSVLSGALMVRPLLGQAVVGTAVAASALREEQDWDVFPNPTTDGITIDPKTSSRYSMEIVNLQGSVISHEPNLAGKHFFQLSNLPSGIYFVRIFAPGRVFTPKKIIRL